MMYIVTGQTATGKTSYALDLARQVNGELINFDSRQIYKEMDIVTGKDLAGDTNTFHKQWNYNNFDIGFYRINNSTIQGFDTRLWLYDIIPPDKQFSFFDFAACVEKVIINIERRGKTPIFVGGTYLYAKHLFAEKITTAAQPDWHLREKLAQKSVTSLQEMLKKENIETYSSLNESDRNNPHRLIRRIEIAQQIDRNSPEHLFLGDREQSWIGLRFENQEQAHELINKRVRTRIKNGAVAEVEQLMKKYDVNSPGLSSLGCKEIVNYLNGSISEDELLQIWTTHEVQYAKRQLTFMKPNKNIQWQIIQR